MSFRAVPRVRAHGIGYPIEQTELAAPVYTKPRPDITEITPDTSPQDLRRLRGIKKWSTYGPRFIGRSNPWLFTL